jgi:hypothetical protein
VVSQLWETCDNHNVLIIAVGRDLITRSPGIDRMDAEYAYKFAMFEFDERRQRPLYRVVCHRKNPQLEPLRLGWS